ncbi:MAG TPA: PEP-CTERM sorting domain-containing protein, partial [Myxococcota bacterium]|nr:PEP-CTERM sorting domain-containing protein [Myxococcota bacterium]
FSQVVDATAGMEASLSGRTIDLGLLSAIAVGSDQLLDIGFQLRSRSWGAAADPARFSLGLVFGSSSLGSGLPVPEPSVAFLIGIGLILMATAERSRRAHPGRARGRNGRLA